LKLIDFGTSKLYDPKKKMNQRYGTAYYMAPEVLEKSYDEKCDVWSCGVVMYILLCGAPPFPGVSEREITYRIRVGKFNFDDPIWHSVSEVAKNLIKKMMEYNPSKRISASQALNHEWIANAKERPANSSLTSNTLIRLKKFKAQRQLQEAIWSYMVAQMSTKDETSELMGIFKELDANGDGQLSRDELILGYKKLMGEPQAIVEVDDLLAKLDKNNSGFIEYSEFVLGTVNMQKMLSKNKLESAFKIFDKDGSGYITIEEFKEIFSSNDPNADDSQWKNMIQEFDENGDGQISMEEFKTMMLKLQDSSA